MGYEIFYLITLLFLTTVSFINFLFFHQLRKTRIKRIIFSLILYLIGTAIISGILVYLYFFPKGEYINRGLGMGVLVMVIDVLLGNAILFFFIRKGFQKNNRHPIVFFLLMPLVALLYFILLIVTASLLG